ncbi:cytochrome c oxidase subunit II [Haloplanus sp. C73]|uniref:cytochrome c oxidase subunit II n=1 Tax=Haloplanus sp. C73 TaxID=3421641 RepID=UPI003EBA03AC
MEIHRYEKIWTVAALLIIVGFIATVTYGTVGAGVKMVDDSGGTVDPGSLDDTEFSDPGVTQVGEDEYEVHVVARQFLFQPGTSEPIRVPANSEVTFYITSADVVHGFELVGTNVNTMVIPGQVAEVTVRFDEPGEYGIVCHEYCGGGHHTMAGQLVVVPEDEYNPEDS